MAWKVELERSAEREIDKLDPQVARRLLGFLHGRVAVLDDPRSIGGPLKGAQLGGLWRYRVGDYRLICELKDDRLVVIVVRVGHRREVYGS